MAGTTVSTIEMCNGFPQSLISGLKPQSLAFQILKSCMLLDLTASQNKHTERHKVAWCSYQDNLKVEAVRYSQMLVPYHMNSINPKYYNTRNRGYLTFCV
jgi:hypothetical protein